MNECHIHRLILSTIDSLILPFIIYLYIIGIDETASVIGIFYNRAKRKLQLCQNFLQPDSKLFTTGIKHYTRELETNHCSSVNSSQEQKKHLKLVLQFIQIKAKTFYIIIQPKETRRKRSRNSKG